VVPSLKAQGGDEPSLHPNAGEIDRAITAFARSDNGGLIVTSSGLANGECSSRSDHWRLRRAPTAAVYRNRAFATAGGLISYGADSIEPHRLAVAYLDAFSRARGQRASCAGADKTRVVINLKTAKALGLAVPPRIAEPPTRSRIYFRLRTDLIVHDFAISRARLSVANYLA